ncbi:MAG: hypothetical protein E6X34_02970 [Clostridium sp.]|uniref:hypothetical protein n=1 Tax=Clostridium sp. TaxID=1506 RepID=UPI0029069976|nr:hypothetical protein [Clostridium sp.]MDU4937401.1 hypothetical protein [Clostridium sp.]
MEKNNEINNKDKFLKNVCKICGIIIVVYIIGLCLISGKYVYHSWVNVVAELSVLSVGLSATFLIFRLGKRKTKYKLIKLFYNLICALAVMVFIFGLVFVSLMFTPEHKDNGLIARVHPGIHHTNVYFFEDINIFIMKESSREEEMYDGSYDRYDSDN